MQNDLFMLGADQVVDDMGSRCVSSRVAEPLATNGALDDARGGMYTAITSMDEGHKWRSRRAGA